MNFKKHITARKMKSSFWQLTAHGPDEAEVFGASLEAHENVVNVASLSVFPTHEHSSNDFDEFVFEVIMQPA